MEVVSKLAFMASEPMIIAKDQVPVPEKSRNVKVKQYSNSDIVVRQS